MCSESGDQDGMVMQTRFVAIFDIHAPVSANSIQSERVSDSFDRCQIFQARHRLGAC
jgi:hypothetical protein